MFATSLDSERELKSKYGAAVRKNLKALKTLSGKFGVQVRVMHGVDGTKIEDADFDVFPFDHICFNFPHTGMQRVHLNRNMIREFSHPRPRVFMETQKENCIYH